MSGAPIRVLVVDDSALVRSILSEGLAKDPQIDVVGTARDPYDARDKIVALDPDVLTLDVDMPRMDGIEFLRRLMPQRPSRVIMVSSLTQRGASRSLQALSAGAIDVVAKPSSDLSRSLNAMLEDLRERIKAAAEAKLPADRPRPARSAAPQAVSGLPTDHVIAIGASTGGTEAIAALLAGFPANTPGGLVVIHMPPGFTSRYAERLDQTCPAIRVAEAVSGAELRPGQVLVAPAGKQARIQRAGRAWRVSLGESLPISGHCPSVDALFASTARQAGARATGVLLTGMGSDGAQGLLAMRKAGAHTICQDEATSVVWGMPRSAVELGAAASVLPLQRIAPALFKHMTRAERPVGAGAARTARR